MDRTAVGQTRTLNRTRRIGRLITASRPRHQILVLAQHQRLAMPPEWTVSRLMTIIMNGSREFVRKPNERVQVSTRADWEQPIGCTLDADSSLDLAELIQTCPIDGMRLRPKQCKLICPVCAYYLGCSDYY